MATGQEIRAQIDLETFKGLLVINGGGAVALLGLLSSILAKPGFEQLARAMLASVIVLMFGLVAAVFHNHLRRRCSLVYEQHKMSPPGGCLFGLQLKQPIVCVLSWGCLYLSVAAFVVAGCTVAIVGLRTI